MSVMKKKMKFCPDLVFFLTFSKLHDSTVGSVFILCCRSVALRTPPTVLLPTVEPGATLFGYIINCKVSCWRRVCSPTRYWEISKMECLTVASCAVAVYNAFFCMTTVAVTLRGFQLQWEWAPFHYHSIAPSLDLSRQAVVINKDPRMWNRLSCAWHEQSKRHVRNWSEKGPNSTHSTNFLSWKWISAPALQGSLRAKQTAHFSELHTAALAISCTWH